MIARMTKLAVWLPLLLLVAACSRDSGSAKQAAPASAPLDTLALLDATYLSDYVPEGSITLTHGAFVDSVNMMSVRLAKRLDGDLNGDGAQDAAGRWLDAKTCMYTNTPDEHFVLDRHPDHPEVLVVSACSGHGFKFASAIGAVIAELVRDGKTSADLGLFELARFR